MIRVKSVTQKKNNNNPYLFINLVFGFFPISFILGSLVVNINFLLFCFLGIYYLKSEILTTKFDFPIKIIFLFFVVLFFSASLSLIKSLYFGEYDGFNFIKLIKSILFFRFFLFLIITYLLSKFNILRFKYFFLIAAFSSLLLSLDIIYQHFLGLDIINLESQKFRSSGFFGDEYVAGGYLLRFGFFAIFFTFLTYKNKNYTQFVSTVVVICILSTGIFFTGNRMPFILFIFGLFLILLFNFKIKKILLTSFLVTFVLFKFIISFDEKYKTHLTIQYESFYGNAADTLLRSFAPYRSYYLKKAEGKATTWKRSARVDVEQTFEGKVTSGKERTLSQKTTWYNAYEEKSSPYRKLFLASIYTWKSNKIFGNGIKSFYIDCQKLAGPDINIEEDEFPNKINLICSNHPHNYYLQILTTTGIVGLFIIFVIGLLFALFTFKNFKYIKKFEMPNIILLSVIISFFLETFPLRSNGSLFTTNNASYIILIGSVILSYRKLIKIK